MSERSIVGVKGFTVVELLVVVGIMVLLSGGAIVAYVRFTERRQAVSDAQEVAQYLRMVQKKAFSVEVPVGCTDVQNYAVTLTSSSVSTNVICRLGSVSNYLPALNSSSTLSPTGPITFRTRLGGAQIASPVTVSTCRNGIRHNITVNLNGMIDGPVLSAIACP